jgi:hypothetical protein
LIRSTWPVHDIWCFATVDGAPKPTPRAQDVLVTRPDFDPKVHALPHGGAAFVAALLAGDTLAEASDAGERDAQAFDLAALLGLLLQGGAITAVETEV